MFDTSTNIIQEPYVVLISMPWTTLRQPSLGLALLCANLRSQGISCRVFHANLLLLKYLTAETYFVISRLIACNEFLFTAIIDLDPDQEQLEAMLQQCRLICAANKSPRNYREPGELFELLMSLRSRIIPSFLGECAERILSMQPTLAGFSCLFDQTIAAVALAKLLKEARPELPVVLGGYAVQHENGNQVLQAFPQIDAIARGDGETVIAKLAWASVGGLSFDEIQGVTTRKNLDQWRIATRADLREALPPDYSDWFSDLEALRATEKISIMTEALPLESSRGCWWGEHSHCVFCGIDEETMVYRSKPAEQVLGEVNHLRRQYKNHCAIRFSDYIFPHHYYKTLLPDLAKLKPAQSFDCEIKANQSRERLIAFANAGFNSIQPGIESFSSPVLKRMKKGVSSMQNVQLLKWGYAHQVIIAYNLLFGFPGDTAEEYQWQVANLPQLYHLQPPANCSEIYLTRFAPVAQSANEVSPLRSHPYYRVLFSKDFYNRTGFDIDRYCYYFERNYIFSDELKELYMQMAIQVSHWRQLHLKHHVTLCYQKWENQYYFIDTRFVRTEPFTLVGLAAAIYALCDWEAISLKTIFDRVADDHGASRIQAEQAIEELGQRRIVWRSDGMLFGLGLPQDVVASRKKQLWHMIWPGLSEIN